MYCVNDDNFEDGFRMQPHIPITAIASTGAERLALEKWMASDISCRPFEFYWSDKDIYNDPDVDENFPEKLIWNYLANRDAVGMRTYFIDND